MAIPATAAPEFLEEVVIYLHELQTRQRWHQSFPNVQVGDTVILRELNTAPLHWSTAIITEVHPGPDGKFVK